MSKLSKPHQCFDNGFDKGFDTFLSYDVNMDRREP